MWLAENGDVVFAVLFLAVLLIAFPEARKLF
jgi:hypothetical protein